jgi:hypothetical protein
LQEDDAVDADGEARSACVLRGYETGRDVDELEEFATAM